MENSGRVKIVFVDGEFTGLHAATTLVSLGLVTLEGAQLYIAFDDYARDQVTDWVRQHVLTLIDERGRLSSKDGLRRVSAFLEEYSQGDAITLVSAGKALDLVLLFELWRHEKPQRPYFHWLECLPGYLRHRMHLDLDTLFVAAGVDPAVDREEFAGRRNRGARHEALYDALVVRECFLRLMREDRLPHVGALLRRSVRRESEARELG